MTKRLVFGVAVGCVVVIGVTVPAFADPGCYTGCTPPAFSGSGPVTAPSGGNAPSGPLAGAHTSASGASQINPVSAPAQSPAEAPVEAPSSGGLPFTGTDVADLVVVAAVLVLCGLTLVSISRRRMPRA
jgi:hypothetical protein